MEQNTNPETRKAISPPDLSKAELDERTYDLRRLYQIGQVRESPQPQFDGMGYTMYNQTNEMADMSYLPPKANKGDSRITTGITHEKDSTLVSFFTNMDFEGKVRVFYKSEELLDDGIALTRLVRKSRELEKYDDKRAQNYRNYVVQGTSFVLEQWVEEWVPNKVIIKDSDNLDDVKWAYKGLKKLFSRPESTLIDGKKVFLENIREKDIQKQPGVYVVEYIPRQLLETYFGRMKRWKNVPYSVVPTNAGWLTMGSIYSDWTYGEVDFEKCEVIHVYRKFEQRYQLYINGVPMLPADYPLTKVSPGGLVPIAKGDEDPINMFAYSKSEPAKTKIDQQIFDEILRLMIVKFQQSAFVPRANNTGRVVAPGMFMGGAVTSNLNPDQLPSLIENPGITQSDFSFYTLLKEQIDSKTLSSIMEGMTSTGSMTATEYLDLQKKQVLKLGGKLDGLIQWEKQMLELRTINILANGGEKDDKGNYKELALEDTLSSGDNGLAVMRFQDDISMPSEQIFNEENQYEEETGTKVEFMYLSPKRMKEMLNNPDYCFYYEVVPVEKNNDKLTQMMFVGMITQAAQIFGMESLQVEDLKKRYAQVMGEEFDTLFKTEEELELARQMAMMDAMKAAEMGAEAPGAKKPAASPLEMAPPKNEIMTP